MTAPDPLEEAAAVVLARDADSTTEWALRVIREHGNAAHYGDCTKVPMTCMRCSVDEAFATARAAIQAYLRAVEGEYRRAGPAAQKYADCLLCLAAELDPAPAETAEQERE